MLQILTNPTDPRYIFLRGERKNIIELEKHLNKIPAYMFLPNCPVPPTPTVFLERFKTKSGEEAYYCSAGLWKEVQDFLDSKKIQYASSINSSFKYTDFNMTKEEFKAYVDSWGMSIQPRDYQYEAAWLILKYKLSLSELCTRSGKTLIMCILARAAKELLGVQKILVIVPSIHLVKQGVKDFTKYQDYFNMEQIWADGEEIATADLTFGTFQSLIRRASKKYATYNPHFFDEYDMVITDEAHKAPCSSIKTILSLDVFKKCKIRFGFTGTLPKSNTIEWLACQAVLGPKIQEIKAKELIDSGTLAEPIIKQFRLVYDPDTLRNINIKCGEYLLSAFKKSNNKKILLPKDQREFLIQYEKIMPTSLKISKERLEPDEYEQTILNMCKSSSKTLMLEQMVTMFSKARIDLMDSIIKNLNKNVIVFAHNTEYINYLADYFKLTHPNKTIYKISGPVTLKKRQAILDKLTESDNNILVGSFGCIGTGLTMTNVDYGIFAQSFESGIITKQSLGRLMLRTEDKKEFYLYDIIDVYPTKKLYKQGTEKIKTYNSENYINSTETIKIPFENVLEV